MDKLSGLASKLSGKKKGESKGSSEADGSGGGGSNDQKDYLDKGKSPPGVFRPYLNHVGLDSVERKFGGGKVDPDKMRDTNEKITDTAREQFEGATG